MVHDRTWTFFGRHEDGEQEALGKEAAPGGSSPTQQMRVWLNDGLIYSGDPEAEE